jgi:hypothetical protein
MEFHLFDVAFRILLFCCAVFKERRRMDAPKLKFVTDDIDILTSLSFIAVPWMAWSDERTTSHGWH